MRRRFSLSASDRRSRAAVTFANKKQQPKKRKQGKGKFLGDDGLSPLLSDEDYQGDERMEPWLGSNAVQAPLPGPGIKRASIAGDEVSSTDYFVFAPKPSDLARLNGGGAWSWDENESSEQAVAPDWNPISGFSRAGDSAPATSRPNLNPLILFSTQSEAQETSPTPSNNIAPPDRIKIKEGMDEKINQVLPSVTRDQVLLSCLGTSLGMGAIALTIRLLITTGYAPSWIEPVAIKKLLEFSPQNPSLDATIFVGSTAFVTSARFILLQNWSEFRESSDRSNQQILTPLRWIDIAAIALLTGASEEILFRGALIPATLPDWRGAVASGLVFGLLHLNGGRDLSFAAWASGVGIFYGLLFTLTNDIWVPIAAHSAGNLASAIIYKQSQRKD